MLVIFLDIINLHENMKTISEPSEIRWTFKLGVRKLEGDE